MSVSPTRSIHRILPYNRGGFLMNYQAVRILQRQIVTRVFHLKQQPIYVSPY